MKKTIEFLKKNGIIDDIQKTIDFAPKNVDKDPNLRNFQKHLLTSKIANLSDEKESEFFDVMLDDIVYAMNIKKTKEGDKTAELLVGLIKEVFK